MSAEEILRGRTAMWMSDEGHSVLFASFNDTLVEEMKIPWYGTVDDDRQYPDIRSLRYPKVSGIFYGQLQCQFHASCLLITLVFACSPARRTQSSLCGSPT